MYLELVNLLIAQYNQRYKSDFLSPYYISLYLLPVMKPEHSFFTYIELIAKVKL